MSDLKSNDAVQHVVFGSFRLMKERRALLLDGNLVRIGGRALDLLIALTNHAGEIVSKQELLQQVWPDITVDEISLRVHITALRKVLGDGKAGARFITNVPGRGYCFVAPVRRIDAKTEMQLQTRPKQSNTSNVFPLHQQSNFTNSQNLPVSLTGMVGRADSVATLMREVLERRFVSIVGPGGIGKTTLAIAVASNLLKSDTPEVCFVDFAPLTDPALVPNKMASVLGLTTASENALFDLSAYLANRNMLIVLDNCEHVIAAATALAESILQSAPQVRILATSREPLRAMGEKVHRLSSLKTPPPSPELSPEEALSFPAIELFVERASSSFDTFELTNINAPFVADICRQLDGIPLAIELAAARMDVFSVNDLAAHLDDRFRWLMQGRRTALPRQKTLRGTLDWSHDLLSPCEQITLRRLSIFKGDFTIDAARSIAALTASEVEDTCAAVTELASKSLINVDVSGPEMQYRLLDTTRAYAFEKLVEHDEFKLISERHAHHYCTSLEAAKVEFQAKSITEIADTYHRQLDNLHAALDWALGSNGNHALGIRLTLAIIPLWKLHSMSDECRRRISHALDIAEPGPNMNLHQEMHLYAALGGAYLMTTGGSEVDVALRRAFDIANQIDAGQFALETLWGLWIGRLIVGDYQGTLNIAQNFSKITAPSATASELAIGDRLLGLSLMLLGDPIAAKHHLEKMLADYICPSDNSHLLRFQFDQVIAARAILAQVLWLLGYVDQAIAMNELNIATAHNLDHSPSLHYALVHGAGPMAIVIGDIALGQNVTTTLQNLNSTNQAWGIWGTCYQGALMIKHGDYKNGVELLSTSIKQMSPNAFQFRYTTFLSLLAYGYAATNQWADAEASINLAFSECGNTIGRWDLAELWRIKGEIELLRATAAGETEAEACFQMSLAIAQEQKALSWQLRTSISLAELLVAQGRHAEARALLGPVYASFNEGYSSEDLMRARTLLDRLSIRSA